MLQRDCNLASGASLLSFPLPPLLFALLPARPQIACGQPVRIASPRPHEVARPSELLNLVFDTARAIGVMQKDAIWGQRSLRLSPYPVAEYTPADAILILGQQCIKSRLIGNRKFLESRVASLAVKRQGLRIAPHADKSGIDATLEWPVLALKDDITACLL